jgi:hypothetical protein
MPRVSLSTLQSLLVQAADPLAPLPDAAVEPGTLDRLLADAEIQGVRPLFLRKLRKHPDPDDSIALTLQRWNTRSILEAGQSLLLRRHADQVLAGFGEAGVEARIIKGPVFADRLYPNVADRPFTDIDLLLPGDAVPKASEVMQSLGFGLPMGEEHSASLMEYKWHLDANPSILVEVHADLVHLPGMRRRLSLDFDRLREVDAGELDPPASLLLIAVIHAAGGHKFHRLQLLVDVLQAVRSLRSSDDEERVLAASRRCGASLEFATVLAVTGRIFDCAKALELAELASSGLSTRLARSLITPAAVLDAATESGWRSRLQRDAFRWVQRMARA